MRRVAILCVLRRTVVAYSPFGCGGFAALAALTSVNASVKNLHSGGVYLAGLPGEGGVGIGAETRTPPILLVKKGRARGEVSMPLYSSAIAEPNILQWVPTTASPSGAF